MPLVMVRDFTKMFRMVVGLIEKVNVILVSN